MKSENLDFIDSLRVMATISVVFLHVAAGVLYHYGSISNLDWWIGNIYDGSVRFCVPIFLMISGSLMFSKNYESEGEFLKKRVLRILLPFLFWSMIYIMVSLIQKFIHGEYLSLIEVLKFILLELRNGACFHLWYIYMIFGLYLFFPIIGKWLQHSKNNGIKYFLGIWLLTVFINMPYVNKLMPIIDLSYFSGYIGFPILGYYLNNISLNFEKKKLIYVLMFLTGTLITIFGTYLATFYKGSFYEGFYSYLSPNVILASVGVFLLFKDFFKLNSKVILFLSKYSYGTYLIHILVLSVLSKIGLNYAFITPLIGIPLISVLCFVLSTLIIWGLNKLPFGKYISG
ncbi:MAG: acyltransferase family protein [Cytophagales bacterium]